MSGKGYGSRDSVQAPLTLITAFGRLASSSTFGRSAQGCGGAGGVRGCMMPGGLAQQRAATTQTPRRPIGAGGVRGASRAGSASVITTHALFARKVQRKLSNGVAGFAAGRSSSDQRDRGQFARCCRDLFDQDRKSTR